GYVGANINRISINAGFAKGTIYNHFASKQALMLTLIDEIASQQIAMIRAQVDSTSDPTAKLEAFFRAGFAFVEQNPAPARVVINALYGPDAIFKGRVFTAYQPLFDLLIYDTLTAGITRGLFRKTNPDETAGLIMTVYLGSCSLLNADNIIGIPPAQVTDFVLAGIRQEGC
ncbi:MAG: TetR/AcrR family transcriptional regulator, partial [Anaerolineae bacterium]|nr:TetR/AcrR family transcriptional regulator [Anaerolineae bacterium]